MFQKAMSGLVLIERGILRQLNGPVIYPEHGTDGGDGGDGGGGGGGGRDVGESAPPSSSKPRLSRADLGTGKDLLLLDICCGKGFFAAVAAAIYPDAEIIMVDCDRRIKLDHLAVSSIAAWLGDICKRYCRMGETLKTRDMKREREKGSI